MPDQPRIAPGSYFLDGPPDFIPDRGVFRIRSRSGGVEFDMVVPASEFLVGVLRSVRAYEKWASEQQGKTVRLPVGKELQEGD